MDEEMTGARKAAILMTMLGEEAASKVLRNLEDQEVRAITFEISRLETVDFDKHRRVLEEFLGMVQSSRGVELAGPPLAKRLLQLARPEAVDKIIDDLEPKEVWDEDEYGPKLPAPKLPDVILAASSRRLAMLLAEEPPQTVALVLALLPPRKAARIMGLLAPEIRLEVTRRMASITEIQPEVVNRVGSVLEEALHELTEEPVVPMDGIQRATDALQSLGRSNGTEIVEELSETYPELAEQLRNLLFTFDMLALLQDRDVQEVLKQIDRSTLAMALKGADPDLQMLFYRNMSERASEMLQEEMEFLGAPRVAEIEMAQRQILDLVLKLEKEGVITIEEEASVAG
jgi:flagellar motor switch protein FliG